MFCHWLSEPMVYGWGCNFVGSVILLMTFIEIKFFYLSMSTTKCNDVPFTHIYESKRYSYSLGSSGWTFVVVIETLGSTLMVYFPLSMESCGIKVELDPKAFSLSNNDCLVQYSSSLCQWILWWSHHFPMSLFDFTFSFFTCIFD
jgi:hypothetical protein